jgi:hypothetical protein
MNCRMEIRYTQFHFLPRRTRDRSVSAEMLRGTLCSHILLYNIAQFATKAQRHEVAQRILRVPFCLCVLVAPCYCR